MSALTSGLDVANFPKVLKPILPFLQRANDFEKRAPLVAFYCRTYAAQLGITIIQSATTKEDEPTKMLIDLMDKLETVRNYIFPIYMLGQATIKREYGRRSRYSRVVRIKNVQKGRRR
jgi:hypothetical protein